MPYQSHPCRSQTKLYFCFLFATHRFHFCAAGIGIKMGVYASKLGLGLKRQREDDDSPDDSTPQQTQPSDCKRLNTAIASPTPVNTPPPLKITDLNDDCLKKCFNYLDLASLFAVSVANEWLRPAANVVYKRKFGAKKVQIKGEQFPFWLFSANDITMPLDLKSEPYEFDDSIHVCGIKTCLQFLRCLGPVIGNLTIGYLQLDDNEYDYIHQYINKYCAETLTGIVFQDKLNYPIEHFDKPFVNVQAVAVYHSELANQCRSFAQWFPNMRSLELRDVKMLDHTMKMPFRHLRDLQININGGKCGLTKRMAARIFHLSPKLQHLKIRVFGRQGMALSTLLNIIEVNQHVCDLHVSMENHSMKVWSWDVERLVNEHPSLIELDLTGHTFKEDDALMVIQQLKLLQTFRFQLENARGYGDFVAQVKNVHDQWKPSVRTECWNKHRQVVTLER